MKVYMTEKEKDKIFDQMTKAGCKTFQKYALLMLLKGYVINVNFETIDELLYEIHKIGVNINQIAKKANSSDEYVATNELKELTQELNKLVIHERKKGMLLNEERRI